MSALVRVSYLFLPWYAPFVLYTTFFVCGIIMLYGLDRHLKSYGLSLRAFFSLVFVDFGEKLRRFSKYGLAQGKVLDDIRGGRERASDPSRNSSFISGGLMHGALFFGFLMLLAYTSLIFLQNDILPLFTPAVFLQGDVYLSLEFLGDTLGLAFVLGLAMAVYRRYVRKLEKLETRWDDSLVLGMLLWIGVSGFVIEALRFLALSNQPAAYSPVGDALSLVIAAGTSISPSQAAVAYQGFWWLHMFSVFALIAVVPYTKLVHVVTSGVNVAVAPRKPMGRLNTPFSLAAMLQTGDVETPPNVRSSSDFAPLQLIALDACTNCGRCQEVCPAYAAGRDLSPRIVVQDLGAEMRDLRERDAANGGRAATAPVGDVFSRGTIRETELWACTTCNACVNVCPVFIDQPDYIVDLRRTLVAENKLDSQKRTFLENIGTSNNPFGLPQSERQSWLTELGVPTVKEKPGSEYLYWVGCQGSYDPRARKITSSVVRILREAKVDFAILGSEEVCTGEPVRRMGEEARFQELALRNIEAIKSSGVRKVVVHCAHCFNTFLNEYPEFGADFQVVHHSQLIGELLRDGRLDGSAAAAAAGAAAMAMPAAAPGPAATPVKVTFHDPCNLGRMNGVFDAPREVLASRKGVDVVEMRRNKANSFCCGGGGANVWYQVPEKKKIGVIRMEEALETGASTLAVGCPFCVVMFEDAAKSLGREDFAVKDIAEIVAGTLPAENPSP